MANFLILRIYGAVERRWQRMFRAENARCPASPSDIGDELGVSQILGRA